MQLTLAILYDKACVNGDTSQVCLISNITSSNITKSFKSIR